MARKRQWRQRVKWKHTDLEHLGTGAGVRTIDELRAVGDPDDAGRVFLGDVIDADQRCQLDRGTDLLHAFPSRRVLGVFVAVDEAAG